MHQYLAPRFFRGIGLVLQEGLLWQSEVFAVYLKLKRGDLVEVFLRAVALVKVQVVWSSFFASEIFANSHILDKGLDIPRRYECIAKSGIKSQLFTLDLNILATLELDPTERNSPAVVDNLGPDNVILSRPWLCVLLQVIPSKHQVSSRSRALTQVKREYPLHLVNRWQHYRLVLRRWRCQPDNSTELILLEITCLVNSQEFKLLAIVLLCSEAHLVLCDIPRYESLPVILVLPLSGIVLERIGQLNHEF